MVHSVICCFLSLNKWILITSTLIRTSLECVKQFVSSKVVGNVPKGERRNTYVKDEHKITGTINKHFRNSYHNYLYTTSLKILENYYYYRCMYGWHIEILLWKRKCVWRFFEGIKKVKCMRCPKLYITFALICSLHTCGCIDVKFRSLDKKFLFCINIVNFLWINGNFYFYTFFI